MREPLPVSEHGCGHATYRPDGSFVLEGTLRILRKHQPATRSLLDGLDGSAAVSVVVGKLGVIFGAGGAVVRPGELPTAMADRLELAYALRNLLGNATKSNSEQPPEFYVAVKYFIVEYHGGGTSLEYRTRGKGGCSP